MANFKPPADGDYYAVIAFQSAWHRVYTSGSSPSGGWRHHPLELIRYQVRFWSDGHWANEKEGEDLPHAGAGALLTPGVLNENEPGLGNFNHVGDRDTFAMVTDPNAHYAVLLNFHSEEAKIKKVSTFTPHGTLELQDFVRYRELNTAVNTQTFCALAEFRHGDTGDRYSMSYLPNSSNLRYLTVESGVTGLYNFQVVDATKLQAKGETGPLTQDTAPT